MSSVHCVGVIGLLGSALVKSIWRLVTMIGGRSSSSAEIHATATANSNAALTQRNGRVFVMCHFTGWMLMLTLLRCADEKGHETGPDTVVSVAFEMYPSPGLYTMRDGAGGAVGGFSTIVMSVGAVIHGSHLTCPGVLNTWSRSTLTWLTVPPAVSV